jgi:hypothetical protein
MTQLAIKNVSDRFSLSIRTTGRLIPCWHISNCRVGWDECQMAAMIDDTNCLAPKAPGPSVIKCCYAAIFCSLIPPKSAFLLINMIKKRILFDLASNISLKLCRLDTNPACIAGVLISVPNFSAL